MNFPEVWQGTAHPLGAHLTPEGVNFALYSENATAVELCLFGEDASSEAVRIKMPERTRFVWHCFIPGLKAGQLYGYRVHGPHDPRNGHRFNPSKLLLDPYAKAITGPITWNSEMFGYVQNGHEDADLTKDERDNAWCMPKSVVVDDTFAWSDAPRPGIPEHEQVIYEVHVKGFSQSCPRIPEEIRGTYAALGSEFAIDYFKRLGITTVELLPVHHFSNDEFLENKKLSNYWGYNSLGYFAPHWAYTRNREAGAQVREFKQMVQNLHEAGLEVILDVVYNHTGEGNHLGPTISFRGIDNASYYRLVPNDRRYYMDYTGTGNTLNTQHPQTLQLVLDSLRYWVTEMRVDGFRFDLASTLAREYHDVSKLSGFFDCIHQDPTLSQVKLIAEPWDVGDGGYQVGNFPVRWAEWNGKYRDCLRAYWKGDGDQLGELAYRLTGSSDLFENDGRAPYASINFMTAHDGFTLYDTVCYNEKHNEANGEGNQDGHNDNRSWNCGVEGPSDDAGINAMRRRQVRNFLATLLLSQGVPMILGGDEFGRTQKGNNNAYCQDNEISWFDWEHADWQKQMVEFTAKLVAIRKDHPVFRRPKYFQGRRVVGSEHKDVMWFDTDGTEMTEDDWQSGKRCLGMLLSGDALDVRDSQSKPVRDDTFLLLFNAHHEPVKFDIPGKEGVHWDLFLDTRREMGVPENPETAPSGEELEVGDRSLVVLRLVKGSQDDARSVSWKHSQRAQAAGPPQPPRPSKHEPIDPTSAGARIRAKYARLPKLSDLSQGTPESKEPPLK